MIARTITSRLLTALLASALFAAAPGCAADGDDGSGEDVEDSELPLISSIPNAELDAFYADRANYRAVKKEVAEWFPFDENACTAFMTTALRQAGMQIPNAMIWNGETGPDRQRVSIWINTSGLAQYLIRKAGWRKITDVNDLRPGDIVFTRPAERGASDFHTPLHPRHAYMFHGWKNKPRTGLVVDNQWEEYGDRGFGMYERNIGFFDGERSMFWFALRAR